MKNWISTGMVLVLGVLGVVATITHAAEAPKVAHPQVPFCIKKVPEGAKLADFTQNVQAFQKAQKLSVSAGSAIKAVFAKIDINKDGVLSGSELSTGASTVDSAAGCGTCDTQGLGCSSGCHCHSSDQSCGKDGDGSGR